MDPQPHWPPLVTNLTSQRWILSPPSSRGFIAISPCFESRDKSLMESGEPQDGIHICVIKGLPIDSDWRSREPLIEESHWGPQVCPLSPISNTLFMLPQLVLQQYSGKSQDVQFEIQIIIGLRTNCFYCLLKILWHLSLHVCSFAAKQTLGPAHWHCQSSININKLSQLWRHDATLVIMTISDS